MPALMFGYSWLAFAWLAALTLIWLAPLGAMVWLLARRADRDAARLNEAARRMERARLDLISARVVHDQPPAPAPRPLADTAKRL